MDNQSSSIPAEKSSALPSKDIEAEKLIIKKSIPLGPKVWASIIIFGFMGQLTWAVENSYFSTYIQQRITAESWATSATVIFSAIFAACATIIGGAISDRIGKRRPFVCWGYLIWGFLTMAFAFFWRQSLRRRCSFYYHGRGYFCRHGFLDVLCRKHIQ